ncbi:VirB4 homolog (VirB4) [Helicobacter ailurogastricus]|nr:VirB4 homolog (VirB4) [Helicobacter ailurogastricus]GLH59094.1 VirB4 homolog (VirB4) [Helicobacter ailurogastricus]GMB89519.1 VirB4 homolog (VirB4) [Helicobacter ailurogastricus]GMB91391.1 VirB4 homolog (VirB4) [Helicobacter ailurogastricus]
MKFGWDFWRNKAMDFLAGALPKVHSMIEENNILGLYNERFLLTKSEQLVGLLNIEGLSANALLQEDLQSHFSSKQNALEQLEGVILRIHTKRAKIQLEPSKPLANPQVQALLDLSGDKTLYENTYTLIFETAPSPLKSFLEQKKLELTTSMQAHQHLAQHLSESITKMAHALHAFKPTPLSAKEALNFYATFINGHPTKLNPTLGFLEDSYIATNIHFKKDHYIQEHASHTTYNRILGVKAYASKTLSSLALLSLLHQERECEVLLSIEPLSTQAALAFVQEKIRLSLVPLVRQELQSYYEKIQAKRLSLQKIALNVFLKAPDLESLNADTKEVLSLLANAHLVGVVETLGLRPAYFSMFPGCLHLNPRLRCQSAQALASLMLFEKQNRGFKSNPWGKQPLSVFKNLDHSPYLFNFHNQESDSDPSSPRVNGHTMIVGASGAGKTTLMGFLMANALKYEKLNILALDRAYGLFSCIHYFGGVYNFGKDFKINPLSLDLTPSNQDFLHSFYARLLNLPDKLQTQADIQASHAILKALKSLYAILPPKSFCLQDFKETLTFCPNLSLSLEPYLQHPLFNALEDSLEFDTPLAAINMDAISANPKDLGLLAYYIFYKILHRALEKQEGFLLFVDEFKSYALNETLNTHINTLITQARKANGVVVLALQDTHQLATIPDAASFVKNMGTLIFYPQKHIDSALLSKDLGIQLSYMEAHFLENTPLTAQQVLVKNMADGSSNIIHVGLQDLGTHLRIFNSNAAHVKRLQTLMQTHPTTWREVLLQEA